MRPASQQNETRLAIQLAMTDFFWCAECAPVPSRSQECTYVHAQWSPSDAAFPDRDPHVPSCVFPRRRFGSVLDRGGRGARLAANRSAPGPPPWLAMVALRVVSRGCRFNYLYQSPQAKKGQKLRSFPPGDWEGVASVQQSCGSGMSPPENRVPEFPKLSNVFKPQMPFQTSRLCLQNLRVFFLGHRCDPVVPLPPLLLRRSHRRIPPSRRGARAPFNVRSEACRGGGRGPTDSLPGEPLLERF